MMEELLWKIPVIAGVGMFISIIGLVIGAVCSCISWFGDFEYETRDGDIGTAFFCNVSFGQAQCRTADGETVMVERYKRLDEEARLRNE